MNVEAIIGAMLEAAGEEDSEVRKAALEDLKQQAVKAAGTKRMARKAKSSSGWAAAVEAANDRLSWDLKQATTDALKRELENPNVRHFLQRGDPGVLDMIAGNVAGDYLRKMGGDQLVYAADWLKKEYPAIAERIAKNHAQHWPRL